VTIYEACAALGPAFCVVVIAICTGGFHCIGRTVRLQAGPVNPELVQPANSAQKPIVLAAEQGLQPMARAFDCEDGDIVAVKGEGAHHGFLRPVDVERHEINALWETMAGQNLLESARPYGHSCNLAAGAVADGRAENVANPSVSET